MTTSVATASVFLSGRSSTVDKPTIKNISIPEAKKRRHPSKHYVYKIVVQWSNGKSTVIYRRYSMFFDFQVKLQELYTLLKERNTTFQGDNCPILPELPGKILFGRTQVHQVAEKRRVKIEEFCEALVTLPSDISESALVLGFFNTWPDDTIHHTPLSREPSSMVTCSSPTSPTSSVINHPDEMENLEQYRVVVDYDRKDSHQVNLTIGQIVHVIEKHYTGWWMIVTDEEQGYAPAAHLEAIDKTYDTVELDCIINEEYEVMDTYRAENDDEIELFPGDRVVILNKSMDGWWKIKNSYGVEGFCPATILRKSLNALQKPPLNTSYESEKDLYQELNIHKPPPRRSTLERKQILKLHKAPKNSNKQQRHEPSFENHAQHYQVPRNNSSVSSGSDENPSQSIDLNNPPFSPDHYEIGPCFNDDNNIHPIYENTEFEQQDESPNNISSHLYQNMEFNDEPNSTHAAKQKRDPVGEDEYINPDEFVRDENTMNASKPGSTNVSYKQVTIASTPLSPPTTIKDSNHLGDKVSHSVRAVLTNSKSLGFIDTSQINAHEEEYIEMDPVYAPVAPDEPVNKDTSNNEASVHSSAGKKQKPVVPPSTFKTKPLVSKEGEHVPQGRVLERTKSLENVLSLGGDKKISSPVMKRTSSNQQRPPLNDYDHLEVKSSDQHATVNNATKKPEPAKKHFHKSVIGSAPSSPGEFRKTNSPPVLSPPHDFTDNPPALPPPNFSPSHLSAKSYLAIESYDSQAPGCLSFTAGDRCMLVRQSNGGWWYVNIGGKEGWTPGDFWQEDSRSKPGTLSQPPLVAPKKPINTKPRSQTHITSFPSDNQKQQPPNNGLSSIVEPRSSSISSGMKPLPGKPRGQPPPRPHPPPSPLTSGNKKVVEHSVSLDSVPPPPPPPRKESNAPPTSNGVSNSTDPRNDYSLLEHASVVPLEDHKWFAGSMEREKAEQFLMEHGRQREFLVRERTNRKGYYALSIRYHYSVKHFNIDPQANGSYSMGVMNFSSIEEVVKHYQINSLFIHDGQPVALGQPVRRKSRVNH